MPPIVFSSLGVPVVTERMFTNALSPRLDASGWDFICQLYNYPNANPAEWVVVDLETGAFARYYDNPYTPPSRGRYCNTNFGYWNQMRAPNGRIFFAAVDVWMWVFDPVTRQIVDLNAVGGGPPYDTTLYSLKFNHDGSRLYGGTLGMIQTDPFMRPQFLWVDTTTLAVTDVCRIGSNGHTLAAWAYDIHGDGNDEWAYAVVGQDIWDVVMIHVPTNTQVIVATATVNAWATFTEKPEGLVANLYTNYKLAGQTVQQWWLVDGVAYPYSEPYNPATLPFTPRNVTPYTNPLVNPPQLDTLFIPQNIGWRPAGSSGAYTYDPFTVLYANPIPIESLVTLPDNTIFGNVSQYQGFFHHNPGTGQTTWFGAGPDVDNGTARAVVGGKVYISGYPNGSLYRYDPSLPWTQPPSGRLGQGYNPEYLGGYSNGLSFSGVKHADFLEYSALTNRLYMVGLRDRSGFGAGVGYYDISAKTFAGTFANLNYYYENVGIAVFDALGRVVIGGHIGQDPSTPTPPPASAELVLFDLALTEVERQVPIVGMQDTGRLYRTGEANVVFGISTNDKKAYRWDIVNKVLLGQVDLSSYGFPNYSKMRPDGWVVFSAGGTLLAIDPITLTISNLGSLSTLTNQALVAFAWIGASMYTSDGATLLVDSPPTSFSIACGTGVATTSGTAATLSSGIANTLVCGTGVVTIEDAPPAFGVSSTMNAGTGAVTADGRAADLETVSPPTVFHVLPPPTSGDGNGPGPAVDMSGTTATKSIVVAGTWPETMNPFITIEVNNDVSQDGSWAAVNAGQGGRVSTAVVGARWMRQNVSNNRANLPASVTIGSGQSSDQFISLPAPIGNGVGPMVDTSGLGSFKSVQVAGNFRGAVIIEASQTGDAWGQVLAFQSQTPGIQNLVNAPLFLRVRRAGVPTIDPGLPVVSIAAIDRVIEIVGITHDTTMTGDGNVTPLSVIAVDGGTRVLLTNEDASPLPAGTPVCSIGDGIFAAASAISAPRAFGILTVDIDHGSAAYVQTSGPITLSTAQWDAVTGLAGGLTPNADYYLDTTSGSITTVPPASSGQSVVFLFRSASATTATLAIERPVSLA